MAFCANCGTQLAEGVKFCSSCGTPAGGAASAAPKPVTEKAGTIRKCPACGSEVPAMTAVCPTCGHELSNVQVANSVQAFFEKLEAIDQEKYQKANAKEEQRAAQGGAAGALGSVGDMFKAIASPIINDPTAERKKGLIEGFPIPNTKEDILEFVVLAASKYQRLKKPFGYGPGGMMKLPPEIMLDGAWKMKIEQAYTKAKISFGSDKDTIATIEKILKQKKIIK